MHHILTTMPCESAVARRNRAVVALAMLTGARDGALASLRLKHIDLAEGVIWQDGGEVRTKFAKTIATWFFPVGGDSLAIVTDWVACLRSRQCGGDDPLFPATHVGLGEHGAFAADGLARMGGPPRRRSEAFSRTPALQLRCGISTHTASAICWRSSANECVRRLKSSRSGRRISATIACSPR